MPFADPDRALLTAMARVARHRGRPGPIARLQVLRGKISHAWWSIVTASDISREARIDPSVRLPHLTGVVIHADVIVEARCMIMQQVTLGMVSTGGGPHVHEDVNIGAGARVLGEITIGRGARIGANAVVLEDVPPHATAVGIPARIVRRREG